MRSSGGTGEAQTCRFEGWAIAARVTLLPVSLDATCLVRLLVQGFKLQPHFTGAEAALQGPLFVPFPLSISLPNDSALIYIQYFSSEETVREPTFHPCSTLQICMLLSWLCLSIHWAALAVLYFVLKQADCHFNFTSSKVTSFYYSTHTSTQVL